MMERIVEFTRSIAPWVVMGLLVTIFIGSSAACKKKGRKSEGGCTSQAGIFYDRQYGSAEL